MTQAISLFGVRWRGWIVALLVCVCTVLPATIVRAQQSPVTFSVDAGYEGAFHIDKWFPVRVTVENSGPDLRGQLVFRLNTSSQRSAYEIDLPRGARKQVTLYAVSDSSTRVGQIAFEVDGRVVAQQDVRLEPLSSDQLLVAVASSDPALLNSLSSLRPGNYSSALVRHIDLGALPEQPQALDGVDVLFLHDLDTGALSEKQRSALGLWLQSGGTLVASGGANGAQVAAGVADLLPVEVTGGFGQGSLESLATAGTSAEGLPTTTTLSDVRSLPQSSSLFPSSGSGPGVGFQRQFGQGRVIFTTFDLAVLRSWRGESQLWQDALDLMPHSSLGNAAREQRFNLLAESLRSNSLALVPLPLLVGLLALYILAIGPINYLVLRRLGKLEWAWATIPLVVFTFVGGIYLSGRLMRGNEARLAQITVVQGSAGQARGIITAYSGLFSPDRSRYTFSYPPETLVQELQSFDDFGSGSGNVVVSDSASEVRDILVDIRSIRTVLSESSGETGISVESNLQSNATAVSGNLRYTGAVPLEDAIVVRGDAFQSLGSLETDATATIDFDPTTANYPWSVDLAEMASIDRNSVLSRLNDIDQRTQSTSDLEAVYLLGWRSTPTVGVRVNGTEPPTEGVTLYIIRLKP